MKRFLTILFSTAFLMLFLNGIALGGSANKVCDDAFLLHYFQNPQSAQLVPKLKTFLDNNCLQNSGAQSSIHFFAAAIRNSKDKAQLLRQLDQLKAHYSGDQQTIVTGIIQETKHFLSPPADSDVHFDLLWSEFFATGKAQPVQNIASYLKLDNAQSKTAIIYLASAEWSLAANASQFPRVLKILKDLHASSTGIMKRRLKRILDDPIGMAIRLNTASQVAPNFKAFTKIVW